MDCSRTFLSCSLPFRVAGWCSSNEMDKISQSSLLGFAVLYKTYFKKIPRTASYTIYIYPLGIRSRYFNSHKNTDHHMYVLSTRANEVVYTFIPELVELLYSFYT